MPGFSAAQRKGFIAISVQSRGPIKRGFKKTFNAASKRAWYRTAEYFHNNLKDKRFTHEHAREAGYIRRRGELIPPGTREFKRSYTGQKLRYFGHTNPLMKSGKTKRATQIPSSIKSTSKGGKVSYRAGTLNYKHPKSKIRMHEEFRRITSRENTELANVYDKFLDEELERIK